MIYFVIVLAIWCGILGGGWWGARGLAQHFEKQAREWEERCGLVARDVVSAQIHSRTAMPSLPPTDLKNYNYDDYGMIREEQAPLDPSE